LIHIYQCDITSRDAVRNAAEAIRSDHGSPSILINNAGIGNANTILEMTPERLRAIFDVNLLSHWHTVQEFLPDMIAKKKGHIMSTASLAAFLGLAGMVDYSCTKAGLIAFHEGLTQELKHRYKAPQIKTSIVYPNWTRTHMTANIIEGIKKSRAPIMEAKDVAEVMVGQIIAAKSGQVVIGPSGVASIRALPMWLQEFIRDRMAQVVTINATTAVPPSS
jgi:all-trans-retinol dehydrogenase (NAD+)